MTPSQRRCLAAFSLILVTLTTGCTRPTAAPPSLASADSLVFHTAARNGRLASEGFRRAHRFVQGWLAHADPATGLLPRNLQQSRDIWNAQDAAADNYPFMVLTAALTDRPLFEGRMRDILQAETRLTSRLGPLPDTYSFTRRGFLDDEPDLARILFGTSEYIKDGLLPLTEWLGPSPWSGRMLAMLDAMWAQAPVATPFGHIVSDNVEINGEMLQTLARVYWMTGDDKYLAWALRLGDYYLLGDHHPTRDLATLRLRDHGCEVVSGLTELYATLHFASPEKKQRYAAPLHAMLDRVLEVGRNEDGLFYNRINPRTGEILDANVADTFGYTLNGFYTVYLIDGTEAYRQAVLKALSSLEDRYRNYAWEGESADGYADAIEGALNLYAREPLASTRRWIESEMQVMWQKQQADGVIEGWHGDGNFARTTLLYSLWKTQGTHVEPWREDVELGAVQHAGMLVMSLSADTAWEGLLQFDEPRHRTQMKLPLDWPRINQFPEWFTVEADRTYRLHNVTTGETASYAGAALRAGLPVRVEPGRPLRLILD